MFSAQSAKVASHGSTTTTRALPPTSETRAKPMHGVLRPPAGPLGDVANAARAVVPSVVTLTLPPKPEGSTTPPLAARRGPTSRLARLALATLRWQRRSPLRLLQAHAARLGE